VLAFVCACQALKIRLEVRVLDLDKVTALQRIDTSLDLRAQRRQSERI